jgi:YegS/Rv2252/BmrU family lipid kinase
MRTCFIYNPRSGRNARRPWLAAHIREFIAAHQLDAHFFMTEGPGHATELARDAVSLGAERVIAVGGDGTMNEVARALLFTPAALGLVPCGSGNGLALHLGIPTDPRRALVLATDDRTPVAAIDTGLVNGRPFFNAMGTGFDAEISRRFNKLVRRGLPAYARTGLAAFLARTDTPVVIRGGGQRIELTTLLVAVANSDQYGNNAVIAPGARVDDGQLDLLALSPVNVLTALPLVARLFARRLHTSPRVQLLRSAQFVIERPAAGLIHTDGETHETGATLEVSVRRRSLRLLVPPTARVSLVHDTAAPRGFELQLP